MFPQFSELQVMSPSEAEEVLKFSRARADQNDPFAEWAAPWRQESLAHYLKIGWSMAKRDPEDGRLQGYVLAQPVLFMRGQTQTVWVEHIDGESDAVVAELLDTIVRVSREKHMQRVLMTFDPAKMAGGASGIGDVIRDRSGRILEDDILEFPTTKSKG
jgi:hypothetical protein